MVRVKICGITNGHDRDLCVAAGVHALGFVTEFPADVPWNITAAAARNLIRGVPPFVSTCMVAGGTPEQVIRLAGVVQPNIVQLHHDETLAETAEIAAALAGMGIKTIKALRLSPSGALQFDPPHVAEAAKALSTSGIHGILVDTYTPERPGGSGIVADSGLYRQVQANTSLPVILAGGLRAENLSAVLPEDLPPFAVDVLSGVEATPGSKDPAKVAALLEAATQPGYV